jgi:hypothetical protein
MQVKCCYAPRCKYILCVSVLLLTEDVVNIMSCMAYLSSYVRQNETGDSKGDCSAQDAKAQQRPAR